MLQPLPTSHPPPPRQPPPVGLDLPESFVGDRTCHGMLGSTLREALEELLLMMQQESVPQLLSPAVAAVPGISRRSRQSRGSVSNPVDRDNNNGASADSQSEDLEHDGNEDPNDGDGSQAPGAARLAPGMVEPILNSLGAAMAKTRRDRLLANNENVGVRLVSGLIRGRVRHWNRRGAKWRIVADADAEIRPISPSQRRRLLPRSRQGQQQTGRRRAERGSLWQAAARNEGSSGGGEQPQEHAMKLSNPLEILAYNDKE
jgi:hypothetical protein